MSTLKTITNYLDLLLNPEHYIGADIAMNGVQILPNTLSESEVHTIAAAVDAAEATILEAKRLGAQMLFVHHGLFWGNKAQAIQGSFGKRIESLLSANIALYASHLPLDGHQTLGNAAGLIKALKLPVHQTAPLVPLGMKAAIGVMAELSSAIKREQLLSQLQALPHAANYPQLRFGPQSIQEIAVATGSASSLVEELSELGVTTLITGEPKHEVFHLAKELSMNVFFAGHYASERFGPLAIAESLRKEFKINVHWLEFPTDL